MITISIFLATIGCAGLVQAGDALDKDCGIIATYVACSTFNGFDTNYTDFLLSAGVPGSERGYTLLQLEALVAASGLSSKCVQIDIKSLRWYMNVQPLLAIALLDDSHFVLVRGFRNGAVDYFDPPSSVVETESEFEKHWTNNVLLISNQTIPDHRHSWLKRATIAAICTALLFSAGTMVYRRKQKSQRI